jgi:SPP1 gp7 family putative phage head morphogenesis protein
MLTWIRRLFVRNEDPPTPDLPGAPPLFSDGEMEWYLLQVYSGLITDHNLSIEYHYKIASYLQQALAEGFGPPLTVEAYEKFVELRKSIYVFSAAKQYSQVREMSALINKEVPVDFKIFRQTADKVFEMYNKQYLKTEYSTAVGQSEMARQWVQFEERKDTLPMLTYHTQRDNRVRDEHASLEGITRPVGDKFWDTYMPKNGWRCRCFVTQHDEEEAPETDLSKKEIPEWGEKAFPKVFRMNSGKDGLIFNPKFHPYFRVAPGDSDFKAQNFGLPTE